MNIKESIKNWIQIIEKEDGKPSKEIIAFNFGLIETENGYNTYLIGSKEYSQDNDDWACEEDFSPNHRYLELPEELSGKTWDRAQEFMESALSELENEGGFNNTFLNSAIAITTGFDDGELIRIKQNMS